MAESILSYGFDAKPEQLKPMREQLDRALERIHINPDLRADWVLAVNEACMNIIQHAYCQQPGSIELSVTRDGTQLIFELNDQAPAVTMDSIEPRPLDEVRPGGLGVYFMRSIMDEVSFFPNKEGQGNRLVMHVELQEK